MKEEKREKSAADEQVPANSPVVLTVNGLRLRMRLRYSANHRASRVFDKASRTRATGRQGSGAIRHNAWPQRRKGRCFKVSVQPSRLEFLLGA